MWSPRPSAELLKSLRVTLRKIEENFASVEDEPVIAELKRIILLRIADIEAVDALEQSGNPIPMDAMPNDQQAEVIVEQSTEDPRLRNVTSSSDRQTNRGDSNERYWTLKTESLGSGHSNQCTDPDSDC